MRQIEFFMKGMAMAVPRFFEFFAPVMSLLSTGETLHMKQIRAKAILLMGVTTEDQEQLLPSGRQRTVDNRINWAISYLKQAGLIANATRGSYKITPEGISAFTETNNKIDLAYLERFESFRAFRGTHERSDAHPMQEPNLPVSEPSLSFNTPQDAMDVAFRQINEELADNLLLAIAEKSPDFFEKLVIELLLKMGYGGPFDDAGIVVGRSGDEGIDGVIREDKLGFSSIYIQAKRWDTATSIGRPDVQKFVGALAGQGAQKGLFITTASFSREAVAYAQKQLATKVVLIDGSKLTKLMIEYDVGVATLTSYAIKRIDTDYFNDDNE